MTRRGTAGFGRPARCMVRVERVGAGASLIPARAEIFDALRASVHAEMTEARAASSLRALSLSKHSSQSRSR